ncbi:MAG: Ig-like domain-containing protein, partial [Bacteroidales bacterium]|nr:Ig-like domain-containing protein [Bacteroidales bacterium]
MGDLIIEVMNRNKLIVSLLLALFAVASCKVIEEPAEIIIPDAVDLVFTASREAIDPGSKTVRLDDGSVWWSPYEEISVFYGSGDNGGSRFISKNDEMAKTVEFDGSIQMSGTGKSFWAVYPYSSYNECDGATITMDIPYEQTGVADNFSESFFPAIAKSKTLDLAFRNVCGGIKFCLSRDDIISFSIKGNRGEALAGRVKVKLDDGGKPVIDEYIDTKTEVVITAPENGTFEAGRYYYVSLLPNELAGGITITLNSYSSQGVFVSEKPQTVKRSIFGVLRSIDTKISEWQNTKPVYEAVDLGLSVKWATVNVGATKPEESGYYYAWGETAPKDYYYYTTYKWSSGDEDHYFKYVYGDYDYESECLTVDYTTLEPEDDAATVNWGRGWRMPTEIEMNELEANCTFKWITRGGVGGFLVTSNKDGYTGNSIFLPSVGFYSGQKNLEYGNLCTYWSSSLRSDSNDAYFCYYDRPNWSAQVLYFPDRTDGCPVRPVYAINPESITLNEAGIIIRPGESINLQATVYPSDTTYPVVWSVDEEDVVSVDQNGTVCALKEGTTRVVATAGECSASCVVTVSYGESIDLSENGTANCYIVSSPGFYRFKADVKGNSNTGFSSAVHSMEVLWATSYWYDQYLHPYYKDGYCYLTVPDNLGDFNALLAARDASGRILWSWHIWVWLGYDPVVNSQLYRNNGGTLMDRNLGASWGCSISGLLYQWGRKDPFFNTRPECYNSLPETSTRWPNPVESTPSTGTIEFATSNPMVFITANDKGDWMNEPNGSLWGKTKTIYDPCPPGWRIPDGNGEDGVWYRLFSSNPNVISRSNSFACTWDYSWDEVVFYYPGERLFGDGSYSDSEALIWTCDSFDSSGFFEGC